MSEPSYARIDRHGGVAVVTMDRPERLNAWGPEVSSQTVAALQAAEADPEVAGVVLTGAGRAFCAGADLKEPGTHSVDDPEAFLEAHPGSPIFDTLGHYSKPVIAAVNGFEIGVGCLMCCACDFVVASTAASTTKPAMNGQPSRRMGTNIVSNTRQTMVLWVRRTLESLRLRVGRVQP